MLQWDELRITPDGRYLIIDVEVQNLAFYDNIYIESLYFVTYKNPDDFNSISDKGTKILNYKNSFNAGKYMDIKQPENNRIDFTIRNTNQEKHLRNLKDKRKYLRSRRKNCIP